METLSKIHLVQAEGPPLHGPVQRAELDDFGHNVPHPAAEPLFINPDTNLQKFSFERAGNNNCYTHSVSVVQ